MSLSSIQFPLAPAAIRELLLAAGIQATAQRVRIAEVLYAGAQHLSAEQVRQRVSEAGERVSKATVYNTLGLFAARGLIREVIVDRGSVFYDSTTAHHHHFYDVDRGELTDIPPEALALQGEPALPDGTRLEGVDIIIRVRSRGR